MNTNKLLKQNFFIFSIFKEALKAYYLIFELAKRDFKSRYIGSVLGLSWAFLQPISMMCILWLVFEFGLKAQSDHSSTPFVVWFFGAMSAWNFFSELIAINCNVLREYSFMLKKVGFNVSLLPIVKIVSALMIHCIFLLIIITINMFYGFYPNWSWIGILYYLFAMTYLIFAISLVTASLNLFIKDISQGISILLQFGFWATPIIWNMNKAPNYLQKILKLNPMTYITEGYRSSLIYDRFYSEVFSLWTIYFWSISTLILFLGAYVFKKLQPFFVDVI